MADEDRRLAAVYTAAFVFVGIMLQYVGMSTREGEGNVNRMVSMNTQKFFGLEPWLLWKAYMLCLLRNLMCFLIVAFVQFIVVAAITGNPVYALVTFGVVPAYLCVAVMTAFMTLCGRCRIFIKC